MSGPKRLWSGDWSEESAAARARMEQRRAQRSALADDPTEPLPAPAPPLPSAPSGSARLLAALASRWRAAVAWARAQLAMLTALAPRGLRARLLVIALLAGLGGAAVTIGVEAASGSATPGSQSSARAWLGVGLADAVGEPGAIVESVYPGSPAAAAGVEPGDVISAVNGHSISDGNAAVSAIKSLKPGRQITLTIERVGEQVTITATLGTRPANVP